MRSIEAMACVAAALCGAVAHAQPCSHPAVYHDLGTFSGEREVTSPYISINAGETVWFKINLPEGVHPLKNWLDLDTSGPSGIANTEMCMYDCRAYKIVEDNDSGGSAGPGANDLAAAISFGGGSGRLLGGEGTAWGGGRLSVGNAGGSDLVPTLPPGDYYIAVVGFNADFSQDPNVNWQVSTNSTAVGSVRLRVSFGAVPATTWNESYHGYDAGDSPTTAQDIIGEGPLRQILTSFGPGGKDMFKLHISNPSAFRAECRFTDYGGAFPRGRLFLFHPDGRGVVAICNTIANTPTILTAPPGLAAGDYYLAVSSRCPGSPNDSEDRNLWTFGGANDNVVLRPNGPGGANPMSYWVRQANCDNIGGYFTRITLNGCEYLSSRHCAADFNVDGFVDFFDYLEFVTAFEAGC